MLENDLVSRVSEVDQGAAHDAAMLAARLRTVGRTVEFRDFHIAGVVAARREMLATGNDWRCEAPGISFMNPWQVG